MEQQNNGSWSNSAVFSGCNFTWAVNKTSVHLFGSQVISDCPAFPASDPAFLPAIFWFFTYQPTPAASVTLCAPTIQLQNVAVTIDISSSNLTSVTTLSSVGASEANITWFTGNQTNDLNGQAYNGLSWPEDQLAADPFVNQRATAIQLQLPAAVFQNAVQSPEGLTAAFTNNSFAALSATVYVRIFLTSLVGCVVAAVAHRIDYGFDSRGLIWRCWPSSFISWMTNNPSTFVYRPTKTDSL